MINARYDHSGDRPDPKTLGRIIDIGGANSFANDFLDAVVDIREPQANAKHKFIGNIDFPQIWTEVYAHVMKHGKWDYAICTHTLEDINNPQYAAEWIQSIAHAGLIVVPSKYRELARFQDTGVRGFMHHRWIFDIFEGKLTGWPKHNFIETLPLDLPAGDFKEELIIEWTDKIDLRYINEGMPYGYGDVSGEHHMKELYMQLLKNEI